MTFLPTERVLSICSVHCYGSESFPWGRSAGKKVWNCSSHQRTTALSRPASTSPAFLKSTSPITDTLYPVFLSWCRSRGVRWGWLFRCGAAGQPWVGAFVTYRRRRPVAVIIGVSRSTRPRSRVTVCTACEQRPRAAVAGLEPEIASWYQPTLHVDAFQDRELV
jgi:hypothetical protein